ncbi:unnamed protein product [Protopolystoma xenopodis]|uniref:Uncharacterized protein n=1 Tax=Protopolystoma xenopodis TaxID=117903 RepID=A0A3S5B9X8_9PLAT|nr:unnamed protein product [Protopolystoma xenopodis]
MLLIFQDLRCKYDLLLKQHDVVRKQLEQETLLRTDLENRHLTLLEDIKFKENLLEQVIFSFVFALYIQSIFILN